MNDQTGPRGLNILSEGTLIPVSLLVVIVGGVFWLSSMYAQTNANAESVVEIKQQQKDDRKEIMDRLSLIDGKIDRMLLRDRKR